MAGTSRRRVTRPPRRERKSRLGLWTTLILVALVGGYVVVLNLARPHVTGDKLRFDTFISLANAGRIRDTRILDEDSFFVGTYIADEPGGDASAPATGSAGHDHNAAAAAGSPGPTTTAPARDTPSGEVREYNAPLLRDSQKDLLGVLLDNRIPVTIDQQVKKRVANLAAMLLPGLALVVLVAYVILSARRGTGLFAIRSGARRINAEEGGVSFAEVAGHDAAIAELRELAQYVADPQRFADVGAQVPRGILLYGPPGCGKTMLARALANESGASFYSISGSDFVELYVGVGASRVRDLFKEARHNTPAIVFIDELDSVGRSRGIVNDVAAHGEQEQALNQILAEMDGFSPTEGIVVVAATNRPDVLDPALLRPGRFDRTIGLSLPDEVARLAILGVHARGKQLAGDVDLAAVARRAVGLTGADLASVMNEGALLAARAGRTSVGKADLDQALQRILEAPERQRRLSLRGRSIGKRFTDEDRVTFADVAGHEEAVVELSEIRDFLAEPDRYAAVGGVMPKGVLLYGPPGCGKTLLARALASEANAAFFSVAASEFIEVLVGKGAARVRDVFAEARSMAPSIIFIDELDSVGRSRTAVGTVSASGEQEQALNQILAEMDGFSPTQGIVVVGATNRPDVLDPALLRPGRFDRTIGLSLPDEAGRRAILDVHAKTRRLAADVDLAKVAGRAIGLTGADLASVLNEAALLAARAGRDQVGQADLDEGLQRILQAPERQRRLSLRGRSIGKRFTDEERATFADVAGADDAVAELSEVKDYLTHPERYADLGARVPRGILLSGPPGCGKTLLARALAGEANAAFLSVAASEFVEVFVGEGAARVRTLFAEARAMAPSIVFIDEIDAIGARRLGSFDGARERDQTLNQILVELDGFETSAAVIVVAATNRPDILDPALVRPGRFDRHVALELPDRAGRGAILAIHGRDTKFAADVDLGALAGLTRGFSGADLANMVNEAALLAVRAGRAEVSMAMLDEAVDRVYLGVASKGMVLSEEERSIVAFHEAGHALVRLVLPGATPPHKVTIVPRGVALGYCTSVGEHDRVILSRSALLDEIAGTLGGRVAEQLVFGEPGSGAGNDLQKANEVARRMVCELGMSDELDSQSYAGVSVSQEAIRSIEIEVRKLLDEAAARARTVLTTHRGALDAAVAVLLEKDTMSAKELAAIVDEVPGGRAAGAAASGRTIRRSPA